MTRLSATVRLIALSATMLLAATGAAAQDDADFRMEIGGALGTSFYDGDVNQQLYKGSRPAVAAMWRYLFDHHNSLKLALSAGGIKGTGTVERDYYPADPNSGAVATEPYLHTFRSTVADFSCLYELNLWPYGYYSGYLGHKRFTPYMQLGLGLTYGSAAKDVRPNLPIGFGLKYKLSKRVNLSLDWTMHFSMSDKLDNYKDPHGIKGEGWKNKDSYCLTMLALTYSFAPICPNCNRDY